MNATEVKLGADSSKGPAPTEVKFPGVSNLGKKPIIGALLGAAAGYGIVRWKKMEGKKKWFFIIGGGVIGFMAGKYWQSQTPVKIKPSKG